MVIGELGAGGAGAHPEFSAAQKAAAEMLDRAVFIETAPFWEPDVEKLLDEGVWKGPEWPRFYNVGSEKGYHYLGSGRILYRIGSALGEGTLNLLEEKP